MGSKNLSTANSVTAGAVGPALSELDSLAPQASNIRVLFRVRANDKDEGMEVGLSTAGLKTGWGLHLPHSFATILRPPNRAFSDSMLQLANVLVDRKVQFETVNIQSTHSPKAGKGLRDLVINGISEAFAQTPPPAKELAAATKAYREKGREERAADRERRENARKQAEKQKVAAKKQIARKIAKEVGQVTDISTFLKALELRADARRSTRPRRCSKRRRFQLFNDVTETH